MNIHVQTQASLNELLIGRSWHWKKFGSLQYLWYVAGAIFITLGSIALYLGDRPFGIMILSYGLYCVTRKKILEFRFKRNIEKNPGYQIPTKWEFTENGITQTSKLGSSELSWSAIYETVTTPEGVLLYPQKNLYFWIPVRYFEYDEQFHELEELLAKKTKNKKIT